MCDNSNGDGIIKKVRGTLLSRMKQVEGSYGYENRMRYSFMVDASPKASMIMAILTAYLEKLLVIYPDSHDEGGL